MSKRLYLGRLPTDARSEDVQKFFEGFGRIIDCRVMTGSSDKKDPDNTRPAKPSSGFGFIEFEDAKDAEDAVNNFNGKPFMGANIVVEFAKESRPRRDNYDDRGGSHGYPSARSRRPPGIRLIVSGISRDTSWQDLKDFGREAGSVSFADIDRDYPSNGILEYLNRDDADRAVKDLDGKELRGRPVRVALDDSVSATGDSDALAPGSQTDRQRGGPDNYRREDRYDRPRDDRAPRDSYREDRGSYRGDRRDRSRSPPRRNDYDDRRPRSPPPRREDDRRPAGYDYYDRCERRGDYYYKASNYDDRHSDDYERRRDDRRPREDRPREDRPREDRPREDRPPREERAPREDKAPYEERPARSNGDGGWTR
ncbi:RNA-binding domain-containing protein [Athelia psychrophila]|uniref:RNA-binding domain-containing protein n=1 Tax=Athelia psychrophila TaxID=1759441 RepID=A0A166GJ86_9AGAM|nr:RNA-binding domain-containing protein [Fibularhizoctonia sp. CBS 109695]